MSYSVLSFVLFVGIMKSVNISVEVYNGKLG